MAEQDDNQAKLRALNKAFVDKMPANLEEIKRLWGGVCQADAEGKPLEALQMNVHKLHGSSGTFGLAEISELLGPFEAFLNQLVKEERGPSDEEVRKYDELVDQFGALVEKAVAPPSPGEADDTSSFDAKSDSVTGGAVKTVSKGGSVDSWVQKRILLADDAVLLRKRLAISLRTAGYEVFESDHGSDALSQATFYEPDLILVDWSMPEMNGSEFLEVIRKLDRLKDVPVFVLSLHKTMDEVGQVKDMGIEEIIPKPYLPDEVEGRVTAFFKSKENASSAAGHSDGIRILVVDDSEELRKRICLCLEADGFKILEAGDGKEAVEKALEFSPDMVLLDVMMPVMNGLDALKKMRTEPTLNKTLIVMLTSRNTLEDVRVASYLGINDYITKPFDPESVLPRVHKCLAAARG